MNNLCEFIKNEIKNNEFINLIKPYITDCECYLVGGFLRDMLSGEKSHDRDLIVKSENAKNLAMKIADNTGSFYVPLDEENKIYRVVMPDKTNYFDISAMLENNLSKDINRRDLTINSIVYDLNHDKIMDEAGGLKDFENKILDTATLQNFTDDPLRMLRVYRFLAKYNFKISKKITDFIEKNAELIKNPAKERINTEIMKLFEGKYSDVALKEMENSGLLSLIFPVMDEVRKIPPNSHHHLSLLYHSIETVRQIERNYQNSGEKVREQLSSTELGNYSRKAFLKLAGFMHDIGKPETWTIEEDTGRHRFIMHDEVGGKKIVPILQDLKFSKKQIAYVQQMIKFHIYPSSLVWQESVGSKARLKFYRKMYPYFADIIILAMSDRLSAQGNAVTVDMTIKNLSDLSVLMEECFEFGRENVKPKPFLSGEDVMKITGLPQSKELGEYVKKVYNEQLDGNITTKDEAENFVKTMFEKNLQQT